MAPILKVSDKTLGSELVGKQTKIETSDSTCFFFYFNAVLDLLAGIGNYRELQICLWHDDKDDSSEGFDLFVSSCPYTQKNNIINGLFLSFNIQLYTPNMFKYNHNFFDLILQFLSLRNYRQRNKKRWKIKASGGVSMSGIFG